MAIDTPAKRSSSLDHEEVWQWGAPLPDGTIGQGDRQHSIWSYSGILAGAVAQLVRYCICIGGARDAGVIAAGARDAGVRLASVRDAGVVVVGTGCEC